MDGELGPVENAAVHAAAATSDSRAAAGERRFAASWPALTFAAAVVLHAAG